MPMSTQPVVALVGEARGEYLFLRDVGVRVEKILGPGSALHVEMDANDLSAEERVGCLVPNEEAAFKRALEISTDELPQLIRAAESRFGVPNLRRLWFTDLQRWRDGASEQELARQTLGYLEVYDDLFKRMPGLVGGFASESANLVKRAFRAVAVHHARQMLVEVGLLVSGRAILIDQDDPWLGVLPFTEFDPTPEELRIASRYRDDVRNAAIQYANPRDMSMSVTRIRNFFDLSRKALLRREPGSTNAFPLKFAADYVLQRARVLGMKLLSDSTLPEDERAVFYPIQFVNDSHVTVRGEAYYDQFALIRRIANCLPYGYRLWIKPHPAAPGDLSIKKLAALTRQLDNVRLINPYTPAGLVLQRSDALVTINSTTGFEALIWGVPVVTLGRGLYSHCGVTYDVVNPADLADTLAEAVKSPPPGDSLVEKMIAYQMKIGFAAPSIPFDLSAENAYRYGDELIRIFKMKSETASAQPVLS